MEKRNSATIAVEIAILSKKIKLFSRIYNSTVFIINMQAAGIHHFQEWNTTSSLSSVDCPEFKEFSNNYAATLIAQRLKLQDELSKINSISLT